MESEIKKGFIYVVVNPAFPDLVKIGYTTNTVEERVYQMSNSSAVPEKFIIAYKRHVVNPHKVEKIIHADLECYRVNAGREFFKMTVTLAINSVLKNSAPYEIPEYKHENVLVEKEPEQVKECAHEIKQGGLRFYVGILVPRWIFFAVSEKDHKHRVSEREEQNPYNLGHCQDKSCNMWRGDMVGSMPNLTYLKAKQFKLTVIEDNYLGATLKDCDRYCILGDEIQTNDKEYLSSGDGSFCNMWQNFKSLKQFAKFSNLEPYLDSIGVYALDRNNSI